MNKLSALAIILALTAAPISFAQASEHKAAAPMAAEVKADAKEMKADAKEMKADVKEAKAKKHAKKAKKHAKKAKAAEAEMKTEAPAAEAK